MSVKCLFLVLAGASAVAVSGSAKGAHVNLLTNDGFETSNLGTASYKYSPVAAPYSFSPLKPYVAGAGIATANPGFAVSFAGDSDPTGKAAGFLQDLGSISETFKITKAGDYSLTFQDEYRPGYSGANTFEVSIAKGNGQLVFPASGGAYTPLSATSFTTVSESPIALGVGTYTLNFLGLDGAIPGASVGGGDRTSYIDNLSLTAVPLPSSTVAGSAFLGVIGLAKWRSRSRNLA